MTSCALLLVVDITLLKIIMFIVVIAIYAINHLLSGIKRLPGQPPAVPPRPAETGRPPADSSDLNVELNEFLRRAAAKRQAAASRPPNVPSASVPPAKMPPGPVAINRAEPPRVRKRKKPEPAPPPARTTEERLSERHVVPSFDTLTLDARLETLRPMSGDRLGEHVQEAFDRPLGQLSAIDEIAPKPVPAPGHELQPTVAQEVALLLRDPQTLRGAVILNEILTPPRHRW